MILPEMGGGELAFVGVAAVAGGAVNALAGGGTLITFPTLLACGVPPLAANVTNTLALCPGYIGATAAQADELRGQGRRLARFAGASALGGFAGALLLLQTGERVFRLLVPFLILFASGLLALQEPLRARLVRRAAGHGKEGSVLLPLALAGVYGGYFGAGLSVIVLALLGLVLPDSLTRLNALKQGISFGANLVAAVVFAFAGPVAWPAMAVMAVGALAGGFLGGRVAGRIAPAVLRRIVVTLGFVVGIVYLLR